MNKIHRSLILCSVILLYWSQIFGQKHYVVEIDRLSSSQKYLLMELVNGRPVEKLVPKPVIEIDDILTIRLTNFNELIYGFGLKSKLIEKQNLVGKIMENPLIKQNLFTFSPTVNQLMNILSSPPRGISRGNDASGVSLAAVRESYKSVLTKLNLLEQQLNIVYDEGAALSQIRKIVSTVSEKYNPKEIENDLKSIKKDLDILKLNEEERSDLIEDIEEGLSVLEDNAENDFLQPKYNLKNLKRLVNEVDFIQEKTIVVAKDRYSKGDPYKYLMYLLIYKKAKDITSPGELTKKPYDFEDEGKDEGDFLRQSIVVDLKMRDSKKIFWTLGVNHVFVPKKINIYDTEYNDYYYQDSLRFIGTQAGGGRLVVGTDFNFPLPLRSDHVLTSFSLGLAMAFSNTPGKNGYDLDNSQAFVTTAIGISPAKLSNLSLKVGVAWAKFQKLSKQYSPDVWYENTFMEDELEQVITRKIQPSFMAGISIRL